MNKFYLSINKIYLKKIKKTYTNIYRLWLIKFFFFFITIKKKKNNPLVLNLIKYNIKKLKIFKTSIKHYNFFNFPIYKIKKYIPKFFSKNLKLNLILNLNNYKNKALNTYYNNISRTNLKKFKLKNCNYRELEKIKKVPYLASYLKLYKLIEKRRKKYQLIKLKRKNLFKFKSKIILKKTKKIKLKKLKKLKVNKKLKKFKKHIYLYFYLVMRHIPVKIQHQFFNEFFVNKFRFLNKVYLDLSKLLYAYKLNRKFIFYKKYTYLLPKKIKLTSQNYFYYCLDSFYTTRKFFYFFLLNYTYYKKSKKYLANKLKYNNNKKNFYKKNKKIKKNNKNTLQNYIINTRIKYLQLFNNNNNNKNKVITKTNKIFYKILKKNFLLNNLKRLRLFNKKKKLYFYKLKFFNKFVKLKLKTINKPKKKIYKNFLKLKKFFYIKKFYKKLKKKLKKPQFYFKYKPKHNKNNYSKKKNNKELILKPLTEDKKNKLKQLLNKLGSNSKSVKPSKKRLFF